ncbi:hypothetical protein CRE_27854 [Caenorhabditis remanei]|uniref:Secreted protein n=1 Tax=Caenorhabditis remanei TaxID=31234 RepID=E3NDL0_CAERE|nr:hypothetical protein CRE_27854 [Caenorhabditis remanei]
MKFLHIFLIAFSFLTILTVAQGVSLNNMDDNGTVPTQRNVPEHVPGSNMIGAGRGRRVQDWKKSKTTSEKIPQQPPNQPQQHDATVPAEHKQ